jgi:hypothetical protein
MVVLRSEKQIRRQRIRYPVKRVHARFRAYSSTSYSSQDSSVSLSLSLSLSKFWQLSTFDIQRSTSQGSSQSYFQARFSIRSNDAFSTRKPLLSARPTTNAACKQFPRARTTCHTLDLQSRHQSVSDDQRCYECGPPGGCLGRCRRSIE